MIEPLEPRLLMYAARPTGLAVDVVPNTTAVVTWSDASASPDLFFSVRRQTNQERPIVLARTGVGSPDMWTDDTLSPGNVYRYFVVASDLPTAQSNSVTVGILDVQASVNLASDNRYAVTLDWTPLRTNPLDTRPATFEVDRSAGGGATWSELGITADTAFVDADVPDGRTLEYLVAEVIE